MNPRRRPRKLHMLTEFVALTAVAPFMFLLAANNKLPLSSRVAAGAVGTGTLLIDGVLLYSWLRRDPEEADAQRAHEFPPERVR